MRRHLLLAPALLLAGCVETGFCAENPDSAACDPWICCTEPTTEGCEVAEVEARCTETDAGPDAGPDADPDAGPDAGPCGMACPSGMPVCDEASGTCVQCNDADATECVGTTPLCDTTRNLCVACLGDGDCTEAGAARCEAGSCVPCDDNGQCSSVAGDLGICDGGSCVQCSVMDETPCSGTSCDPATNTCTLTPLGMTPTCGACVADSECMTDHRCVPMTFGGSPNGAYCMKTVASGCARPFSSPLADRVSLSGAAEDDYCGIDETTVSCDAARALVESRPCADGMDSTCAADGALCRTVGVIPNRCTYACGAVDDCPAAGASSTCGAGYCGS